MSSRIGLVMLGGNSMKEITKVVVDAMGGDNAPQALVEGVNQAIQDVYQQADEHQGGGHQ